MDQLEKGGLWPLISATNDIPDEIYFAVARGVLNPVDTPTDALYSAIHQQAAEEETK